MNGKISVYLDRLRFWFGVFIFPLIYFRLFGIDVYFYGVCGLSFVLMLIDTKYVLPKKERVYAKMAVQTYLKQINKEDKNLINKSLRMRVKNK